MIGKRASTLLLGLLALPATATAQGAYDALPRADSLPEGVVQLSPTVPGMGAHWGAPATMPLGPIYCVHQGRIVCLEFMIAQDEFAAGKSWPALSGMAGLPAVDHVNIGFEPEGHAGFEVPHYDMHLYFLSPEEMARVRPE
ncbi:hypothetical protein [uncultured Paracoccus sp.]|uniref:hypothetical protein n=1 Tax=uncultured Paracoccus sp. TaxID=189685 RepID=UPI002628B801|nr:hypothetical protein [uncultured Paracoccus sp.]